MKKQLLLVLLAVGAVKHVSASEIKSTYKSIPNIQHSKTSAVDRLIDLTFNKELILATMKNSFDQIKSRSFIPGQAPMSKEMEILTNEFFMKTAEEIFSETVMNKIKKAYTQVYTEKELEELVKFYESSVGKKTLEKLPEISGRVAGITTEITQKHMTEYITQLSELAKKSQVSQEKAA